MPKVANEKLVNKKKLNKKGSKNKKETTKQSTKDEKFSFDDEIVIGLKRIDEPTINTKSKSSKNKKTTPKGKKKNSPKTNLDESNVIIKSKYMSNYEESPEENNYNKKQKNKANQKNKKNKTKTNTKNNKELTKQQELARKKRKAAVKIIKWITIIGIIVGGIIYAMLSPIFNIKNITVEGNSKISSETIVSLSELNIDQNIFNFRTSKVKEAIKQNPYIDNVEVKRKFPDTVEISVTERTATFMLTYGNAYVYINNQGYILEITKEAGEFPILESYETPTEQIVEGNRLNVDDLEKLNDVLKIMEAISSGADETYKEITKINIEDRTNYILTIDKEKKIIYLGDTTNLSNKVLWINKLLEEEKKNEGTIYLNVNLNTELPYFREKV